MVEVFKTNVSEPHLATILLDKISEHISGCEANFDLEDCDRILRVERAGETVPTERVIHLLKEMGFYAEVLGDEIC